MLSITEKNQRVKLSPSRVNLAASGSLLILKKFDINPELLELLRLLWHINILRSEGSKECGKTNIFLLTIELTSMSLSLVTNMSCQCFYNLFLLSLISMTNIIIMHV